MMKIVLFFLLGLIALLYQDSCRKDKNDTSDLKPKSTALSASPAPAASTENADDVVIDFESCWPERKRIDVAFGSTTFEIVGKAQNGCRMKYGREVENPAWNGFLDKSCVVPFSFGKQKFSKTNAGVDFSSLASYCQTVSRPEK